MGVVGAILIHLLSGCRINRQLVASHIDLGDRMIEGVEAPIWVMCASWKAQNWLGLCIVHVGNPSLALAQVRRMKRIGVSLSIGF